MKCRDCNCAKKGYFKSKPDAYVCIGVKEPFVISNLDAKCVYKDRQDNAVNNEGEYMEESKFNKEDFTDDELMLLKMAFNLVDIVVETQRTSNYDVYLANDLYNLKAKLGISNLIS